MVWVEKAQIDFKIVTNMILNELSDESSMMWVIQSSNKVLMLLERNITAFPTQATCLPLYLFNEDGIEVAQ
jgi:hypothetical protein